MLDPVSGLAFQVPLVREASEKLRLVPAEVWDWKGVAQDQGQEAAQWLSGYLGSPARLLRYVGAPLISVSGWPPLMPKRGCGA